MSIREVRNKTGLTQVKFAEKFGIPLRTIQKWEIGQAEPRPYMIAMMLRILELEAKVGGNPRN